MRLLLRISALSALKFMDVDVRRYIMYLHLFPGAGVVFLDHAILETLGFLHLLLAQSAACRV